MEYENLTEDQKKWVEEIQKDLFLNKDQYTYRPEVICDTETGNVYSTMEGFFGGMEVKGLMGRLPLEAIPERENRSLKVIRETIYRIEKG